MSQVESVSNAVEQPSAWPRAIVALTLTLTWVLFVSAAPASPTQEQQNLAMAVERGLRAQLAMLDRLALQWTYETKSELRFAVHIQQGPQYYFADITLRSGGLAGPSELAWDGQMGWQRGWSTLLQRTDRRESLRPMTRLPHVDLLTPVWSLWYERGPDGPWKLDLAATQRLSADEIGLTFVNDSGERSAYIFDRSNGR